MSYWYQKEYPIGELYGAFRDVSVILGEETFDCVDVGLREEEKRDDVLVLVTVLRRLCSSLVKSSASAGNLVINARRFTWKRGVGKDEVYCMCRQVTTGWLLQLGGSDDFGIAVNFGWRKLSHEHPLAHTTITAGPSQHLNLCSNYQT